MAGSVTSTGGITYPTAWGISTGSEEVPYDNLIVDRSVGGILRVRSSVPLANIDKTFKIVHSVLTLTQKNDIQTFYATYRDSNLDLYWKPDTLYYAVRFIDIPKYTMIGGNFWSAETLLAEI